MSAAYRVAEEEASALKRRLEEVEAEIAAAVVKQQQAQVRAQHIAPPPPVSPALARVVSERDAGTIGRIAKHSPN